MPMASKWIITSCVVMFFISAIFPKVAAPMIGYPWYMEQFNPIGIIGHMFLHGGLLHLFLNMLVMFFFCDLEKNIGTRKFVILYFVSGLGSYLLYCIGTPFPNAMVGASGAIMGIIGAMAIVDPKSKVCIIFLPFWSFQIWKMVLCMVVVELILGFTVNSPIGHLAHAGGAITGAITLLVLSPFYRMRLKSMAKRTKWYWKIFKN